VPAVVEAGPAGNSMESPLSESGGGGEVHSGGIEGQCVGIEVP